MVNHPNRSKAAKRKIAAPTEPSHNHEHDYSALLTGVRASFNAAIVGQRALFATDADGLNAAYLDALPSERQVHDCFSCRRFIGTYGNLVVIDASGALVPVMWDETCVPDFYQSAFAVMHAMVKRARVTSVFLCKESTWGSPVTGDWQHMSITPPDSFIYHGLALTAGQAMAATKENFRTVATALSEFTSPMLDEALRLLQADALSRAEKFIGPVKWLRTLQDRPKGRLGENILWRAIATAPEGYCHPKASVIAPLLADIVAGLPFDEIKSKFEAMLHPLRYQRPQVAPSVGNIKAAEALVEKLGIARSLERRFARVDELHAFWTPAQEREAAKTGGVFGHLKAKDDDAIRPVDIPAQTFTWEKFARTVLPSADRMEIKVPSVGNFTAYLTAVHADAPNILKWDNTVSAYVYHNGSHAVSWNLRAGVWKAVLAISARPNLWGQPKEYLGEGLMLAIDGCCDTRTDQGNALFPETLRDDLHGARATIEAYSKTAKIGMPEGALACGYGIGKGSAVCHLRVFSNNGWSKYKIDRWD